MESQQMPKTINDKLVKNSHDQLPQYQVQEGLNELEPTQSIIISKNSKCCPCNPEYSMNNTLGDHDIGEKRFNVTPVQNLCCCHYQIDINNIDNRPFMKTIRTRCFSACPIYESSNMDEYYYGKEQFPCCMCIPGSYVFVGQQKKFWVGQDCKDYWCYGEDIRRKDIWNSNRTMRLGSILMVRRVPVCVCLLRALGCCDCCCCCIKRWNQINFPQNATPEEKASLMAAGSNGLGENIYCCCPYHSLNRQSL